MPTVDFQPNQDVTFEAGGGDAGGAPNNTVGQRYTNVDEIVLDTDDSVFVGNNSAVVHGWRANVGSYFSSGARISAVKVLIDAQRIQGSGGTARAALNIEGTSYNGTPTNVNLTASNVQTTWTWATNPATSQAWTAADLAKFDTTDEIESHLTALSGALSRMYRYILRVDYDEESWGAIPVGF